MMHRSVDRWVQRLQWPIAYLAVIWLPCVVWALLLLAQRVVLSPFSTITYGVGIAIFVFAWRSILRFRAIGPWLMRAEHEATHLLFAVITLHPIVGLSRQERQGSYVRFLGSGNWLIQIAPYFFPTAAILLWFFALVMMLFPLGFLLPWTSVALGIATGFHVVSTIREIRRDYAELESLSWKFCWMFLPTANLLMLGLMVAFSHNGFEGVATFVIEIFHPVSALTKLCFG